MSVASSAIIAVRNACSRIRCRSWNNIRRVFSASLLCLTIEANAYGTSQCDQWQASRGAGSQSVTSAWVTAPEQSLDQMPALCDVSNATRAYCEGQTNCAIANLNSGLYTCSNWRLVGGVTVWPNGFPQYTASQTLQFDRVVAPPPVGNGTTSTFTLTVNIANRTNPAGCQVYISALFSPPAQCGPTCNGVSDPISPASGAVYSTEPDTKDSNSAFAFKRFYNSTDVSNADISSGWRHSFSRAITPVYSSSTYKPYETRVENSSLYNDEALACTSGFAEIKSRVSTWANATVSYSNGMCVISVGTTVIARLPILYTSPPTPAPNTTTLIGYDVTRDDGQSIRFAVNGSSIAAPPSIGLTLQQTSNGYALTDANDTVETYDTNGKLLSVANRAGMVQTMSYDSAGRLSVVTDNFGHQLTLSYGSQNRLITMVRQ